MHQIRKIVFIGVAVLALGGGATAVLMQLQGSQQLPSYATVMPTPMPLPEFQLLDQTGEPFDRQSLRGGWSLVFFGFTHCPDICPATLQQLAIARGKVMAESNGEDTPFPQIILISVDPERDSVEIMREYVAHFAADVKGVTGSIEELKKLTAVLGIFFEKSTDDGEDYNVAHSAVVLLINPDAEFHALFSAPHAVENFVNDVPLLVKSR
jgi:protein SCO1/2